MTVGTNRLPLDSARAGTQGFLCPFPPSLGQNPRESKERQKAKDSSVGSWQSRGGGAGRWLGEGAGSRLGPGPATRWRPKAGNGGQGKGEQQGPRRGPSGPGGQVFNPQDCPHSSWPPGPKSHPPRQPLPAYSPGPGRRAHPQKAMFKPRQTCLSPTPP